MACSPIFTACAQRKSVRAGSEHAHHGSARPRSGAPPVHEALRPATYAELMSSLELSFHRIVTDLLKPTTRGRRSGPWPCGAANKATRMFWCASTNQSEHLILHCDDIDILPIRLFKKMTEAESGPCSEPSPSALHHQYLRLNQAPGEVTASISASRS